MRAWKDCPMCKGEGQVRLYHKNKLNTGTRVRGAYILQDCPICAAHLKEVDAVFEAGYLAGRDAGKEETKWILVKRT